jgi:metallophosphoesterase superfamily enzyme
VMLDQVKAWRSGLPNLEIILVPGNHDRKTAPPPWEWNFQVVTEPWASGPFLFAHVPVEIKGTYVMAGHLHPAVVLKDTYGPSVRAACFRFGKRCAILPAFGSFTGMSNLRPKKDERIFIVGTSEVVPF